MRLRQQSKIDDLGRVVIPAEIRKALGIKPSQSSLSAWWHYSRSVDQLGRISVPADYRAENDLKPGTKDHIRRDRRPGGDGAAQRRRGPADGSRRGQAPWDGAPGPSGAAEKDRLIRQL